jgi:hypothetical protein
VKGRIKWGIGGIYKMESGSWLLKERKKGGFESLLWYAER